MTNAIEVTKREMYTEFKKLRIYTNSEAIVDKYEAALEAHLEALRQDRAALVTERDTLRNRVQVLEMANATSGEVIRGLKEEAAKERKARMKARLEEFATPVSNSAENVASADTRGDTDDILELRSRMVADLIERHDARKAQSAEQKRVQEERVAAMNAEVMKVSMGMNRMLWSLWADAFSKEKCMHSFHPAFPSGELCTFCGVGK